MLPRWRDTGVDTVRLYPAGGTLDRRLATRDSTQEEEKAMSTPGPESDHAHRFVIPVESTNTVTSWYYHSGIAAAAVTFASVTKLRCECGEETDRKKP
jgi:hypothetical protein